MGWWFIRLRVDPFYERLDDKMRFWIVLQYPLHQAILVDNGKIVRLILDHSVGCKMP